MILILKKKIAVFGLATTANRWTKEKRKAMKRRSKHGSLSTDSYRLGSSISAAAVRKAKR